MRPPRPLPLMRSGGTELLGVCAIARDDVWAVGVEDDGAQSRPLALHFDGTEWGIVATPTFSQDAGFWDVSSGASDDVWAVGFRMQQGWLASTLIEHWDGSAWSVVQTPSIPVPPGLGLPAVTQYPVAVSAFPGGKAWAVGDFTDAFSQPFALTN